MMRSRRKVRKQFGKSKRIKLTDQVPQQNDSDTETDEAPNEEEEIDLAVPDNDEDDPLRFMPNYENKNPNVEYDHNYISKTVKAPRKNRIMLRQDLFPSPIPIKSDPYQSSQKLVNKTKYIAKNVRVLNKKKDVSINQRNKSNPQAQIAKEYQPSVSLKVDTLTESNQEIHTIPEIHRSIIEKEDGIMYVHEDLEELIVPATLFKTNKTVSESDTTQRKMLPESYKTQKISKVTTNTLENKQQSRVAQKATIIIDDDYESPKHQSSSKKPIILKPLQSKEVPDEVAKAKTLPVPTLVPETSIIKPKDKFILPKIMPEPNPEIISNIPQKHNKNLSVTNLAKSSQKSKVNEEPIIIDDDEPASQELLNQTFVLMKVNASDVPEEIKKSKLVLLAPAFVPGTGTQVNPIATILQGEQMFVNTNMAPHLNGNSSGILKVSDLSRANACQSLTAPRIDLMSNVLPNSSNFNSEITGGNGIQMVTKNVVPVNLNKTAPMVPLRQQTSKTGSTIPKLTVMNQDGVLASTSKTSSNNNDTRTNDMSRFWADVEEVSSSDDEACEGELGLNSIEELKDLWELITELYSVNNQAIKTLVNKKRRFQQRIKAVEDLLEEALERTQKNGESSSVVTVPTETKSPEKHKEE